MKKYLTFVEKLHRRVLTQELDRIMPILADEGMGKSTLILETIYYYEREVKGRDLNAEDILDHVVWSSADELRQKMVNLPRNSAIGVMDAARLLNRKEGMKDEQKELEKDLFDSRTFNHFLLLGFQSPRTIPADMASRRAKNLVYLPARGRLFGYSRETMNEWDFSDPQIDDVPDPDLRDSFPSLDGTDLWEAFRDEDLARKSDRITPVDETDDGPPKQFQLAEEAKENLAWYVSEDGRDGELYIDSDMIGLDFEISEKKATQVRKLLERDDDVTVEPYRVLLDGEVVREVEPSEDDEDEEREERDLKDIAEEVFFDLGDYIGQDGRTGDFLLDPDLIAIEFELSDRKARQVRKRVESFDGVSIRDDHVARDGDVVASQSRDV